MSWSKVTPDLSALCSRGEAFKLKAHKLVQQCRSLSFAVHITRTVIITVRDQGTEHEVQVFLILQYSAGIEEHPFLHPGTASGYSSCYSFYKNEHPDGCEAGK